MIFVTTGQRIAVENFSKGAIYKVTFTDESISYMMCVGIGKDFVMLQSTDPLLFSLTMQSASRVSTIDVHDPTPPEPPTPIENALQYQTGEPPFTFTTTENSLFSWYIEGEAGVKTANLTKVTQANSIYYSSYNAYTISDNVVTITGDSLFGFITEVDGNKQYNVSAICDKNILIRIREYSDVPSDWSTNFITQSVNAQLIENTRTDRTFTTNAQTRYVLVVFYAGGEYIPCTLSEIMLNAGSTALPYEPFGFKISISTNEHTTTIYLDEPIAEGEKLYSVNVDAQIVTDIGENTLSVSDPQPPEMQIVYGIYAEA